jgi:hypothetical protein
MASNAVPSDSDSDGDGDGESPRRPSDTELDESLEESFPSSDPPSSWAGSDTDEDEVE